MRSRATAQPPRCQLEPLPGSISGHVVVVTGCSKAAGPPGRRCPAQAFNPLHLCGLPGSSRTVATSTGAAVQTAQRNSLRLLQWMMAASLALPACLFVGASWMTYRSTLAGADKEIQRALDVAYEHALKVFETIDLSLSDISEATRGMSDQDLHAHGTMFHLRLKRLVERLPQVKSMWIFDAGGRSVVNSIEPSAGDTDFSDRDYFRAHLAKDIGLYIGRALAPRPPYTGAGFFSASRRRQSDEGHFLGVIQASILPEYFESFYGRIGHEQGSFFAIGLADGSILARYPRMDSESGLDPGGPIGRQIGANPGNGLITFISPGDGVERRVGYQRLNDYRVYVAAGLETGAIRSRWMRTIGNFLLFGAPATGALFLILWLALNRTRSLFAEASRRREAEEALTRGQRLEALGQLTGGVAHDFNNLLTIIGSSADLLRRPALQEAQRLRYATAISDTVGRAAKLTSQLLAFARRQPLKPEPIDVNKCIAAVTDIIRTLMGARIEVFTHWPDSPVFINADLSQFETALINLAANARDAMEGGGILTISVHRPATLPATLQQASPHDFIAVSMADTGIGISVERIERIFDPFFTTKPIGRGTGLGLSQVFGFVKQSGGEVIVRSEVGSGSLFTLILPASKAPPAVLSERPVNDRPHEDVGKRILIVEDNPNVGAFAALSLGEIGYETLCVSNAAEALRELAANADHYDIVFSDVMMPGMNGIELAETIGRAYPDLPVILATGYSEMLAEQGIGGFDLIQKPYSVEQLSHAFANVERPARRSARA